MAYRFLLLFILLISVFIQISCNKREGGTPMPVGVISHEQMVSILVDIHLTDAKVKLLKKQKGNTLSQADCSLLQDKVFETHGVLHSQFDQSLSYYTAHPEELDTIYNNVIAALEEKKIGIYELNTSQKLLNLNNK